MFFFLNLPARKSFRIKLRAAFIIVGGIATFITAVLLQKEEYYWAILPALLVLLVSLAEFVLADIVTERKYPARTEALLEKLEMHLSAYHDRIRESIGRAIHSLRACDNTKVSGTFHLVVDLYSLAGDETEQALVQVTDYSGRLGGDRWRFTSATKGLIGRCLRAGQAEWVNFATEEEYRDRMVREFGYSPHEVEQHTREARSYWAGPVFVRDRLIGIIFLFSTELQIFPSSVEKSSLEGTAREIAAFLEGARIV